jgi:hypothetical protein
MRASDDLDPGHIGTFSLLGVLPSGRSTERAADIFFYDTPG